MFPPKPLTVLNPLFSGHISARGNTPLQLTHVHWHTHTHARATREGIWPLESLSWAEWTQSLDSQARAGQDCLLLLSPTQCPPGVSMMMSPEQRRHTACLVRSPCGHAVAKPGQAHGPKLFAEAGGLCCLGTPPHGPPHPSPQELQDAGPEPWRCRRCCKAPAPAPAATSHHLAQGREQAQLARRDPCPRPPPPVARPPRASLGPCPRCTPPAPRQAFHSWLGLAACSPPLLGSQLSYLCKAWPLISGGETEAGSSR